MPYLIGADEAGYGPNLGPLVIAASVWQVPDELVADNLYELLQATICRRAAEASATRLAVGDSKLLYSGAAGLGALERGVLAMLGLMGMTPPTCVDLWQHLAAEDCFQLDGLPWHADWNQALPTACDAADVVGIAKRLWRTCAATGIELLAMRATTIFPARFNELVEAHGSKGEVLSRATLELIGQCLGSLGAQPATILCDKHGGRARYQRLLQLQFPESLIEVIYEGPAESIYRWGNGPERIEMRFRVGGEAFLPTALASMTAKYLRELAMRAFNTFWRMQVADLKPTAGYPVDARRFKHEIAAAQAALGIGDHLLWRLR